MLALHVSSAGARMLCALARSTRTNIVLLRRQTYAAATPGVLAMSLLGIKHVHESECTQRHVKAGVGKILPFSGHA